MQMTKKTKKLEKENTTIKTKCETMNKNILEMAEEVFYYFFLLFFLVIVGLSMQHLTHTLSLFVEEQT